MPWRDVAVSEQREGFHEDYRLNYYSLSELAGQFKISRKTGSKWIDRFRPFLNIVLIPDRDTPAIE